LLTVLDVLACRRLDTPGSRSAAVLARLTPGSPARSPATWCASSGTAAIGSGDILASGALAEPHPRSRRAVTVAEVASFRERRVFSGVWFTFTATLEESRDATLGA